MEYFESYLVAACSSLLGVSKDQLHKSLHEPSTQITIKNFVQEKQILLVSKQDDSFLVEKEEVEDEKMEEEN